MLPQTMPSLPSILTVPWVARLMSFRARASTKFSRRISFRNPYLRAGDRLRIATSGDRPVPGPTLTYWKSNPYLTSKFTGESDAMHAQWVVVDIQVEIPVNAIRIVWASPYATTYQVEYWNGTNALDFDAGPKGEW